MWLVGQPSVAHFGHRNFGRSCQDFSQFAGVPGIQMRTSTNAMPVFTGSLRSNSEKASSPPAEAPIPTMGKGAGGCREAIEPPRSVNLFSRPHASERNRRVEQTPSSIVRGSEILIRRARMVNAQIQPVSRFGTQLTKRE